MNVPAQTIRNNIGAFGPIDSSEPGNDDPEIRAAAIIGHLGLPAEHATYLPFFVNCEGDMLMGDQPDPTSVRCHLGRVTRSSPRFASASG